VAASELALTQARALRDQQENVLRSVLDPQSLNTSNGKLVEIVATDELLSPPDYEKDPAVPCTLERSHPRFRGHTAKVLVPERKWRSNGSLHSEFIRVFLESRCLEVAPNVEQATRSQEGIQLVEWVLEVYRFPLTDHHANVGSGLDRSSRS
jgi:hypothetical protein